MKYIYIYCLTFFITSCKSSHSLIGSYKCRDSRITSTLVLDSQNRFTYNSNLELIHVYSEGKWWSFKDTLFIKSNEEITKENGKVTEEIKNNVTGLTVLNIFNMAGANLANVPVIINEHDTIVSSKNGFIKYYKPFNSLLIRLNNNYDFFYTKKNINSNTLNIYVDPLNSSNKYFILKNFLIRGRKLINNSSVFIKE